MWICQINSKKNFRDVHELDLQAFFNLRIDLIYIIQSTVIDHTTLCAFVRKLVRHLSFVKLRTRFSINFSNAFQIFFKYYIYYSNK